jgi:hypothetical protein
MHPPGNEAPVHPAGAFPFAHRIEANIAKLPGSLTKKS